MLITANDFINLLIFFSIVLGFAKSFKFVLNSPEREKIAASQEDVIAAIVIIVMVILSR